MSGGITNALKGIGGEYELTRVVGGVGAAVYMLGVHSFVAWDMIEGRQFDVTAYCVGFPAGLAAIIAAIAGGASLKDRNVAVAKDTEAKTKAVVAETGHAEAEGADKVVEVATEKAAEIRGGGP